MRSKLGKTAHAKTITFYHKEENPPLTWMLLMQRSEAQARQNNPKELCTTLELLRDSTTAVA
jgi:hypothetical protein